MKNKAAAAATAATRIHGALLRVVCMKCVRLIGVRLGRFGVCCGRARAAKTPMKTRYALYCNSPPPSSPLSMVRAQDTGGSNRSQWIFSTQSTTTTSSGAVQCSICQICIKWVRASYCLLHATRDDEEQELNLKGGDHVRARRGGSPKRCPSSGGGKNTQTLAYWCWRWDGIYTV